MEKNLQSQQFQKEESKITVVRASTKKLNFIFEPIAENEESYFELNSPSASAQTPNSCQIPDSKIQQNRLKFSNQTPQYSTSQQQVTSEFAENGLDNITDFKYSNKNLQLKSQKERLSVNFSYLDEKQVSNQSIATLEYENADSGIKMTLDQTPKLAPPPAPSQNNSFTISADQKVQEKNILPGNQLKHNVFNGLGALNQTGFLFHGQNQSNTSVTKKGRLLPKRTGMFGRQTTNMRNTDSDDFNMFGSGINSRVGNSKTQLAQQELNSQGEAIMAAKVVDDSSALRFSTKNYEDLEDLQQLPSIQSRSNKQSGLASRHNQIPNNNSQQLGHDNQGSGSQALKNEQARGNVSNNIDRNTTRKSSNRGENSRSQFIKDEQNSSFSSEEISDSRRELCPPNDYDNNLIGKSQLSSKMQAQNNQRSLIINNEINSTKEIKAGNNRHMMIGNPKKLRNSQVKEGFSAHREAFLKSKINNNQNFFETPAVKKQTSIPTKQSYSKQNSNLGGEKVHRQQSNIKRPLNQASLRPGQLKPTEQINYHIMPGMTQEPPSPLLWKKATGVLFQDAASNLENQSVLGANNEIINEFLLSQGGNQSPLMLPDETPTQRLVKALKFAKQMKEQKEKEEALRLELQSAMNSEDFKTSNCLKFFTKIKKCLLDHETWIIYPEDKFKGLWDMVILTFVIITCIYAPLALAFNDSAHSAKYAMLDWIINAIFICDIIINCLTAYYDGEFNIIRNHRMIIRRYMMSRFLIDLIAVVPFDMIIDSDPSQKSGLQFLQLSRLNRLKRLTRMFQLVKMLHIHNSYIRKLKNWLNIDSSSSRFHFLMINLVILQHVVACIWIFFAKFDLSSKNNWIFDGDYNDMSEVELYVTSYYFTVTTIMTVGYGDITAQSLGEKLLAILLMLIGVIAFSFATGSISNIIANADTAEDKLRQKMEILKELNVEYGIDTGLYNKVVKALQYGYSQTTQTYVKLLDDLPVKLRVELSMAIHQKIYSAITFFKEKDKAFIAWVGPLLRRLNALQNDYIYKETEHITEIFFLSKGKAGYVLPRYSNCVYVEIEQGENFGHLELANNKSFFKEEKSFKKSLNKHKDEMKRAFTIRALDRCDLLTLSMDDMDLMKVEFSDVYFELIQDAKEKLQQNLKKKKEEIQKREIEKTKQKSNLNSKLSSMILSNLQKSLHENVDSPKLRPKLKERLWAAAQRSLRLQRLTKTQVFDSYSPSSPLEKGRTIRNIFLKAAQLASQNKTQVIDYEPEGDDANSKLGRSRTNVSQLEKPVNLDNNIHRTSTFKVGQSQPTSPMNRARSPLANLLLGAASLTPRPKMGGNISPFSNDLKSQTNQSQNLDTHMTPTLNGPQPYLSKIRGSTQNVSAMNLFQKQRTQQGVPAVQVEPVDQQTNNKLSDSSANSSSYSTDPNKKEIHEMKTMVTRINIKMDSFESILNEMRDEQSKMFAMLQNHIMLQQSQSSGLMQTESYENNQYEDNNNNHNQDDQQDIEDYHIQQNNTGGNQSQNDHNHQSEANPYQVVINMVDSQDIQGLNLPNLQQDKHQLQIASFDNVSALMYQRNSILRVDDSHPPGDNVESQENKH